MSHKSLPEENSVFSFRQTLERILELNKSTLRSINAFQNGQGTTLEYDELTEDITEIAEDDEDSPFIVGRKVKIALEDMDYISWKGYLENDIDTLELLISMVGDITPVHDNKLQALKNLIDEKIANPITPGNRKVIVFTAFTDTAKYLYENISGYVKSKHHLHTAMISGTGDEQTNFPGNKPDMNRGPRILHPLKCGLFKGDDKDVFLDRRDFTGSVPELIDVGLDYILAKINMGCYFQGAYRHDRYELPPDEMRELVINAFAHRLYLQHDAPVFIAIYDSRIEITSPGGLPRGQTATRALAGYSKIRNDVLAKALNYMRFIEEWGSGLRRINKVFADYGLREISLEDAGFAVKMNVYRAAKAGDEVVNPDFSSKKRKNVTVNVTVNDTVNDTVKPDGVTINDRLIESVRKNPGQNADFHARQLGRTRRTVALPFKALRASRVPRCSKDWRVLLQG